LRSKMSLDFWPRDTRADDQKIAGQLGVTIRGEGVVVDEGLILRVQIEDGGLGDLKAGEGVGERGFRWA